jgi:hypothetical protein
MALQTKDRVVARSWRLPVCSFRKRIRIQMLGALPRLKTSRAKRCRGPAIMTKRRHPIRIARLPLWAKISLAKVSQSLVIVLRCHRSRAVQVVNQLSPLVSSLVHRTKQVPQKSQINRSRTIGSQQATHYSSIIVNQASNLKTSFSKSLKRIHLRSLHKGQTQLWWTLINHLAS